MTSILIGMKIARAALAAAALSMLLSGASALAQPAPPDAAPAAQSAHEPSLDELLDDLRKAKSRDEVKAAQAAVLSRWLDSGDATADLLMRWALAAMGSKNLPRALDLLDAVTQLEPAYVEGWNKRATVHFMRDEYGPALSDLLRALAIEPRHFGALAGLGTILEELGKDEDAVAAYRRALEVNPHLEEVRKSLDKLELKVDGRPI